MTVSNQIIAVMDDLCQKFGVAIDWSQENMVPYLTDLAGRYIRYEIATSIAWCVIVATILTASAVICKIAHKIGDDDFAFFITLVTIFAVLIFVVVVPTQAFDIIECLTIPEKTIIEYINVLLRQK